MNMSSFIDVMSGNPYFCFVMHFLDIDLITCDSRRICESHILDINIYELIM